MSLRPSQNPVITHDMISNTITNIFNEELHAKRVLSLSNAVQGVVQSASLAIHAIGHGLSVAQGTTSKHAIKQVDRLLSNAKIDVWEFQANWIVYSIGERKEIILAMDWTDFALDDQTTLSIQMLTTHGRSTPLLWKTYRKSTLRDHQRQYENELLDHLKKHVPCDVKVTIVADRGFASEMVYESIISRGFDYIIRFKGWTYVESNSGTNKKAKEWLKANGRARMLRDAKLTEKKIPVNTIVCYREEGMKNDWCIASSRKEISAGEIILYYSKRWSIECSFRDLKDDRFGFGLENVRTRACDRRDRLLLLGAIAVALLTLLGAAGEAIGFDRQLYASTAKKRQLSLIRQGLLWYSKISNMKEERLLPLMNSFAKIIKEQGIFNEIFFVA
jgi:transposase